MTANVTAVITTAIPATFAIWPPAHFAPFPPQVLRSQACIDTSTASPMARSSAPTRSRFAYPDSHTQVMHHAATTIPPCQYPIVLYAC
ncbi:hypothetical protein RCH14_000132 [Massilia sp. MP_M2]